MLAQILKALLPAVKKKELQQGISDPLMEARRHIDEKRLDAARTIVDSILKTDPENAAAWCLKGEIQFWEKDDEAAIGSFQTAFRLGPELHRPHYGLSLVYRELGEGEKARLHAQYALARDRNNSAYAAQAGLCELDLDNNFLAVKLFQRSLRHDPNSAKVWNNLGIAHRNMGQLDDARSNFRRSLELDPDQELAHRNLAQLYGEVGEVEKTVEHERAADAIASNAKQMPESSSSDESAASLHDHASHQVKETLEGIDALIDAGESSRAIALAELDVIDNPTYAPSVIKLCELLDNRGDTIQAMDVLEVALIHAPENPQIMAKKGYLLEKLGHSAKAVTLLERANTLMPNNLDILAPLANACFALEDYVRTEQVVENIHAIGNNLFTRLQLATAQLNACHYDAALENFEGILHEQPDLHDALFSRNLAMCLLYLGKSGEALDQMNKAIAAEPANFITRFARALINLLIENYEQGWDDYCYRFYAEIANTRLLPFPTWEGQPLAGKRILVVAEQGLGDQVMFASCLPDLLRLNPSTVLIEAHGRLERTFSRSFPDCRIIGTDQGHKYEWVKDIGEIDYFIYAGDLARRFRTGRHDFPRHEGYLRVDPARVEYWRNRLSELGEGPKIGLSWRGGTQKTRKAVRSLDLEQFAPLLRHPKAHFISLQYGDVEEEATLVADRLGIRLPHWPEGISDLDEFASLICALDLVISVCNTTVHFAGALGKPVWVISPAVPEWRYGLTSDSMPWYPSTRMFRQPSHGDWETVIDDIGGELDRLLSKGDH